jgi:penicillin-binding protein 1A
MIGDVTEGIAKDASLGERPVASKTGTSENFFDAWFVGYVPQMVTGIWMGYGEGGANLEYTLDYARKLNGLSGGITPAEIWKTYMQEVMAGKPVENFEGVELPKEPSETTTEEQPGLAPQAQTPPPAESSPAPSRSPGRRGAAPETTSRASASAAASSPEPSASAPASAPTASPAPR